MYRAPKKLTSLALVGVLNPRVRVSIRGHQAPVGIFADRDDRDPTRGALYRQNGLFDLDRAT